MRDVFDKLRDFLIGCVEKRTDSLGKRLESVTILKNSRLARFPRAPIPDSLADLEETDIARPLNLMQ